jgi:hypothetical protein
MKQPWNRAPEFQLVAVNLSELPADQVAHVADRRPLILGTILRRLAIQDEKACFLVDVASPA